MLNVRRLAVLKEVASAGSISSAAKNLGYTHSAVSQQLRALERETRVVLLERQGRTVRLTRSADILVAHAKTLLAQLELAEADLAATRGRVAGRARVAAFPTAIARILPAALATLRSKHPELDVELVDLEPQDSLPQLAQRQLDVVVAHEYELLASHDNSDFQEFELFSEPVLLVSSAADAPVGPARLSDYADRPWIVPHPQSACGLLVERACASAGFVPSPIARTRDFDATCALAAAGIGVALVPELGVRKRPGLTARQVAAPRVSRRVYLAARHGTQSHPMVAAVLDAIRNDTVPATS